MKGLDMGKLHISGFWGILLSTAKGGLAGTLLSLVAVLVFALIVKIFAVSNQAISIVNQVLRILSIVFAVWCVLRSNPEKGWLKGALSGFWYTAMTFVVFSLIDGQWVFGLPLLYDVLIGAASGAVAGILLVNLRLRR